MWEVWAYTVKQKISAFIFVKFCFSGRMWMITFALLSWDAEEKNKCCNNIIVNDLIKIILGGKLNFATERILLLEITLKN